MNELMTAPDFVSGLNIPQRMERLPLTNYQRKIFLIVATAWLFDAIDLGGMTFLLAPISTAFGLTAGQTGLLGSSSLAGMGIGSVLAGMWADKFGRKVVFQWSMILWGLGALFCAGAWNFPSLMAARLLLGFGMGAEFPVAQSILSEITPADRRGKYIALAEGMWPMGFVLAGCIALVVLPVAGWRAVFLATALPAIFVLVIRRQIPESPRWHECHGDYAKAEETMRHIEENVEKALGTKLPPPARNDMRDELPMAGLPIAELLSMQFRARTLMIWFVWFFLLLGYFGITTWMGKLLVDQGFRVTQSTGWIVVMTVWGVPGFFSAAYCLERFGRRMSLIGYVLLSAATAFIYGRAVTLTGLVVSGAFMQFFLFGMWSVLYAYTPELFPTRARATACGAASSFGRLGAFLGPLMVPIVLTKFGNASVFALGASSFVLAALAVFLVGPETKGRVLEDISASTPVTK